MNTLILSHTTSQDSAGRTSATDLLQRLAELTLQVAEHTARQILQDPAPAPQQAAPAQATPRPRRPNPLMVFDRLIRTATAALALKNRIATARPAAVPAQPRPAEDCRRQEIAACLHNAIESMPNTQLVRADLHHQVEPRIDEHLAADQQQKLAAGEIALNICEEYGIPFEISGMSDAFLVPPVKSIHARQQA